MALTPGLTCELSTVVDSSNTAARVGAGGVEVFGTPYMIALMEAASFKLAQAHLRSDESTVGTLVEVRHLAATPPGMTVRAVARRAAVAGRRRGFAVEAFDAAEKIGEGRHERVIINLPKFLARTAAKADGR